MKSLEPKKIILIGASTGGPSQIQKILCALPLTFDATIIIAQHMGDDFIPSFAQRLALTCQKTITVARNTDSVKQSDIFITSQHCRLRKDSNGVRFAVTANQDTDFNPDINQLFTSALDIADDYEILAVILTGIGDDGVEGCTKLFDAGVQCVAESEASSVVYGMPARAKERMQGILVKDLDEIIMMIQEFGGVDVSSISNA